MEWWTSEEINIWERARRRVSISSAGNGSSATESTYRIQSPDKLSEATMLYLLPSGSTAPPSSTFDGENIGVSTVERYGHRFAQVSADLGGEHELRVPLAAG